MTWFVQDFEAYEAQYNVYPAGGVPNGVLTVDGVHPCEVVFSTYPYCPFDTHGDFMMANSFARTLLELVKGRKAGRPYRVGV